MPQPRNPTWLLRASTVVKALLIHCLLTFLWYVCLCVSVQGEAALRALHCADRQESAVLLWTLSADDPHKQATIHQLHTC